MNYIILQILLLNINDIYLKMLRKWIVSSVSLSIGINLRRWEVNLVNSYIYSLITNYIIIYIHTHTYILIPIKINFDIFVDKILIIKKIMQIIILLFYIQLYYIVHLFVTISQYS